MAKELSEFQQLESFFNTCKLPSSIQLDSGTFVPDVSLFVNKYLDSLRSGEMSETEAAGRYYRLHRLQALLKTNN